VSESVRGAIGRKVISRASAEALGVVAHVLIDPERGFVTGLVIGKGKKAQLIDWDQIGGFGPDAVVVSDEAALRAPADDRERRAASGDLGLVGKRALSEAGNELGQLDDITFDPATGALDVLRVGGGEVPAGSLLGGGSYAAVLSTGHDAQP